MDNAPDLTSLAEEEVLDTAKSLDRLDNEVDFLKEIYALFLEDGPQRLERFEQAADADDLPAAAKAAHSLKGMCGTVNAPALMELSLRVEQACREGDRDAVQALRPAYGQLMDLVLRRMQAFIDAA
ncbi:Hpt protein [Desulfovibrio sp. X2]|uniref:Hpt domain-containing protein n=1 Tax=Desulfovibrio sp. X2 TaxID=941449 RepID=UPI000358AE66|nr:Hpt domain-containing protein [Desulfovibrio sp. X2]EPR44416.1 Hpt protein [Desulfovibrio sp. X2]